MKAAHFLIDMQVTQGARIGYADWTALSHKVCEARSVFGGYGVPTVHLLMVSSMAVGCAQFSRTVVEVDCYASMCNRFMREHGYKFGFDFGIPISDQALVAPKMTRSGCTPGVMKWIAANRIDTAFLSGIYETCRKDPKPNTESCVTATAMGLAAAGIKPIIVAEATNIMNDRQRVDPRSLEERARDAQAYGVMIAPLRECLRMVRVPAQEGARFCA